MSDFQITSLDQITRSEITGLEEWVYYQDYWYNYFISYIFHSCNNSYTTLRAIVLKTLSILTGVGFHGIFTHILFIHCFQPSTWFTKSIYNRWAISLQLKTFLNYYLQYSVPPYPTPGVFSSKLPVPVSRTLFGNSFCSHNQVKMI